MTSIIYSFLYGGVICLSAQIVYDNTKLSAGHITSIFVSLGAVLEFFNIYDIIIEKCGVGANLPILSFGHSLMHASLLGFEEEGIIGIFKNIFDLTSSGISFTILIGIIISLIFKPKD